ncbi:MAG: hypothetical protein KGI80_04180 [Verrucomicrobiota bacterium]|nr:hypothetical protein [Verrucomicrobiota bacterium]
MGLAFDKVVIWGHKLHSHTHSYIHQGFYRGFSELGYKTYWLDNSDDISSLDLSNALFITEGQVCAKMPLRADGLYVLHNVAMTPEHRKLRAIVLQVYLDEVEKYASCKKVAECIYEDVTGKALFIPWATDLLPREIEAIEKKLPSIRKQEEIWWVGTLNDGRFGNLSEIEPFQRAAEERDIPFFVSDVWVHPISDEEHRELIAQSYLAPAIVGEWQKRVGYIPCRIFKNISYGQLGVTNSYHVWKLFGGRVIYHPDTYQLFLEAQKALATHTIEKQIELMEFVKNNHTYLNRISVLLDFLKKGYPECF